MTKCCSSMSLRTKPGNTETVENANEKAMPRCATVLESWPNVTSHTVDDMLLRAAKKKRNPTLVVYTLIATFVSMPELDLHA